MSHLMRAKRLQDQYNNVFLSKTVAEVNYYPVDTGETYDILFEGTRDLEDAKRDLEALMETTAYGRVHKGANDGLQAVYQAEASNLPKDRPIRLDGHSLGAMEAGLFACILRQNGFTNVEVLTFESPLWGDAQAMAYFSQIDSLTYQNYLNLFEHDIFTTIPVHLIEAPYVPPPNRIRFWSAPTPDNEWRGAGIMIEAHSLQDCVIPYLEKICGA